MTEADADVKEVVRDAARFHGHLGPFLVVGVRMGLAAVRGLGLYGLEGKIAVRLLPPFSCVIDGVQVATHCTVGNRKLIVQNSNDAIMGEFVVVDSPSGVRVCVRSDWVKRLMDEISRHVPLEELAWRVAASGEEELFRIEPFHR